MARLTFGLGFFWFVILGLHGGEEKNLLDVVAVRQEHGQSVDAHPPSSGGWEAVLQRCTEVLVQVHGLVISTGLVLGLLLKPGPLHGGIVQLSVGVTHLLLHDEQLESLRQTLLCPVPLGQGRHDLGVLRDEGWVDAGLLQVVSYQLVQQAGGGPGRGTVDLREVLII